MLFGFVSKYIVDFSNRKMALIVSIVVYCGIRIAITSLNVELYNN